MYELDGEIYDQVHQNKDYEGESRALAAHIRRWCPEAASLLDVACGSGLHLEWLRGDFACEGLDLNPRLLARAEARVPGVPLHLGDMEQFDLGRTFDVVVCLFGSIGFLRTPDRLARAIGSMAAHVAPGGLLVIEPWLTPDQFWPENIKLDVTERPGRTIARMYVAENRDNVAVLRQHFLIGEPTGVTHVEATDYEALFHTTEITGPMEAAGFEVVEHDPQGLHGYGLIIARRP